MRSTPMKIAAASLAVLLVASSHVAFSKTAVLSGSAVPPEARTTVINSKVAECARVILARQRLSTAKKQLADLEKEAADLSRRMENILLELGVSALLGKVQGEEVLETPEFKKRQKLVNEYRELERDLQRLKAEIRRKQAEIERLEEQLRAIRC